jgi:hypothetical protein
VGRMPVQPFEQQIVRRADEIIQHAGCDEGKKNQKTVRLNRPQPHREIDRQQRQHHLAAVERRDRQHVEDREQHVQAQRLEGNDGRNAVSVVQHDGGGDGDGEIAERSGNCYEHVVPARMLKIPDIDGGRLRPAKDKAGPGGQRDQRQQKRSNGIDVDDGIEGNTAEPARRIIAQTTSGPGVRRLMHCKREQQN